ncbi:protein FAM53B [Corythoichthys intestinalis]|uniref:protein FAM53B n=1 Tax=Corythoichthys intestinalis TaxID=161448 RepID=UPI0025A50510|nr:protein FAM53B [Corythoichthys intestinalis]XP_061807221.1 protein FAM53B-like [Nerophis lumbriciformis]
MCVAMVIICKKRPEKGGDNVTSKSTHLGPLQAQTMSQGTALFSHELMDTRHWCEVAHGCASPQSPVGTSLESLWDALPQVHRSATHWSWDVGSTSSTVSSLLQNLSLTEAASSLMAAPPSKRQCRSLSCSDDLHRSTWRPQGSRVWTTVEKRRCHSGGSVHRNGIAQTSFPVIQRSSSFSLPAALAQPLYLSHEQIPEPHVPSPVSSPDSTPELERRGGLGGLARSRSQPCVLNDKKIGVKRRRQDDAQRPSLDLAKMTQKLRNFHSLSCPGITGQSGHAEDSSATPDASDDVPPVTKHETSARTIQEVDWISTYHKDKAPIWAGLCRAEKDSYLLGGELDIEQIERN